MRKFLLVLLIGMVLAMNIYGIANDIITKNEIEKAYDEIVTVVEVVE